jgi:cytochrome P450
LFTRFRDIAEVLVDTENFSNALQLPGEDGFGGGITLPHNPAGMRMSLAEMDGTDWRRLRKLLNPVFTAAAVSRFSERIREITTECIDRFIETGSCDLVLDVSSPVPAIVTLEYLGMDTADWERFAVPVHASTFTPRDPANPEFQKIAGEFTWIYDQIRGEIARRRRNPGKADLLAAVMAVADDGDALTDDEVFELAYTTLAAGVDTTTSLVSAAFWHLDQHPEDRERLLREPELIPVACEEFLRFYSPSQSGARTVTCPVSSGGVDFQRGDRVLLAWSSANRDGDAFDDPDTFVLDRKPNRHMAFGWGIHRCIGLHLARQEFIIIMEEVLRRLPDFQVDRERTHLYPDVGLMYGYQKMPAIFTPPPAASLEA